MASHDEVLRELVPVLEKVVRIGLDVAEKEGGSTYRRNIDDLIERGVGRLQIVINVDPLAVQCLLVTAGADPVKIFSVVTPPIN